MANTKRDQTAQSKSKDQGEKTVKPSPVIQYIPLIAAVIAAVGFIVVAMINRSTALEAALKPIESTQTAEARLTAVAMTTQAYLEQMPKTQTPSILPSNSPTVTGTTTMQPVLIFYVSADAAGVYEKSDQAIKPFQMLPRGTSVEVLDASDSTWLYVTLIKDRTKITGFVLREQFTLEFVPMETTTPTP